MLVDLHVHAGPRGLLIEAVASRAAAVGLGGVAVLGEQALAEVPSQLRSTADLIVFAGAHVSTDRGHYLVFLPKPAEIPSLDALFGERVQGVWAIRDVLARTRAAGGAVIAANPYDATIPHPGGDILYTLPGLTAVESVNTSCPAEIAYPAIEAAECLGLPCVGGSGARKTVEDVGSGATLFTRRLHNEAELVAALRSGACWPVQFGAPSPELLRRPRPSRPPESHGGGGRDRRPRHR